ncbi:MAG: hypothetical protein FWC27_03615 [Firmicutes bacterium]|nr:hypothetical protein [Bacillota bacterium]
MKLQRATVGILILLALSSLVMASRAIVPRTGGPTAPGTQAETETEPPDTEPPEILGVRDLAVSRYGAPAYRQGVSVTDNEGEAALEVDSAGVNTDAPGEYVVVYIARDSAGNEARAEAKVTVAAVSEEEVAKLADPILESLLLPGASDTENALAIHTWVKEHITYVNAGEKKSVIEGAYNGLMLRQGDCYTYYALSKYLLERAGIESIDMRRVPEAKTRHYWLAVDLGEGWHHFDACPVLRIYKQTRPREGFMMTEAEVQAFVEAYNNPDYYRYDPAECLPAGVEIVKS